MAKTRKTTHKMKPSAKKHSKKSNWFRRLFWQKHAKLTVFVVGFAVVGTATLLFSYAATSAPTGPIKWANGFCIDDRSGKQQRKNTIELWKCNNGGAQQWKLNSNASIQLGSSNYCLDVKYASTKANAPVWLWTCNHTVAQQWKVQVDGSIMNPHSRLCLTNVGAKSQNGNALTVTACNHSTAQHWTVPKAATPKPSAGVISASHPCGGSIKPPKHYKHVIWILEENRGLKDVIGSSNAPYITSLAKQCAYSTKFVDNEPDSSLGSGFHSVSHYIADLSGSNCITGNGKTGKGCLLDGATYGPATHNLPTTTILDQIAAAHLTWKSYQESAPHNCTVSDKKLGLYAPWHDGVLYYTRDRAACQKYDVPIPALSGSTPKGALINDIKNNTLPSFAYVTPNLEHDMHNVGPANADKWLKAYLPTLFNSKSYKAGDTAVFLLWDEARKTNDTLPNVFIAPSIHSGSFGTSVNGFAVLGATEDMLGLPRLGCATGKAPGNVGQCYTGATTSLRQLLPL